ncbi:hypothetical protein [Candidatus Rariloculus sp.]|uniref:hypothetical protein n=1 Tax=Candidatus Rariloculus sp. TaxID=3101265 RepID=UPI003D137E63
MSRASGFLLDLGVEEHQRAYGAWRQETGFRALIDPYVESVEGSFYNLIED